MINAKTRLASMSNQTVKNCTSKTVKFKSGGNYSIYGKVFLPPQSTSKGLILFHGGKAGSSKRFELLQPALAIAGIGNLAINFRGRGESSGVYKKSTLNDRLTDSRAAIRFFKKHADLNEIGIIGISLGADAVRLLREDLEIKIIILVGPVAVSEKFVNVSPPHRANIISSKDSSWRTSPILSLLSNFKNPKLIIYGEKEDVASPEMIKAFKKSASNSGKFITLTNAKHNPFIVDDTVQEEQKQQEATREKMIKLIVTFVKNNL